LTQYQVHLSVPQAGGWRARSAVRGESGRRLAEPESPVIAVRMDNWARRGRDYLHVMIVATIDAAHAAGALDLAWQSFISAAGDNPGWDMAAATAEVRPCRTGDAKRPASSS